MLVFSFKLEGFNFNNINFSLEAIMALLYLTIFNILICYLIQTSAQKYVSASVISIFMALSTLFGSLFSLFIFNESLTLSLILGGGLIFLSLIISCKE